MVKTLITNKVTAIFTITLGKPIAYAMHALPTAVSRTIKICSVGRYGDFESNLQVFF
jgi:hypothetical protein